MLPHSSILLGRLWLLQVGLLPILGIWAGCAYSAEPPARTKWVLVSDQYCPYACNPGSAQEGYLVELARGMLEPEGFDIEYQIQPWNRALRSARSGLVDGIFGISQSRLGGLITSPAIGVDSLGFMTTKKLFSTPVTVETLHQLDGLRLAQTNIANLNPARAFDRYLIERFARGDDSVVSVSSENPVPQMVKMLLAARVDVVVENPQVLAYTAKILGQQSAIFIQGSIESRNLYIAFRSDQQGRRAAQIIARELPVWRASGRLGNLLASYGLTDWQSATDGEVGD